MYISIPNSLTILFPILPPGNHMFAKSTSLYFLSSFVSFLFRLHIYGMPYDISPSLTYFPQYDNL